MKRGRCSFSRKLANIPSFAPSRRSLKLVVIVSEAAETGEPGARPMLDEPQRTPGGLLRHHPIPMVMVEGVVERQEERAGLGARSESLYDIFSRAKAVGLKRRYWVHSQGVPISNLIVL